MIDENAPEVEIGNLVNDILLRHKGFLMAQQRQQNVDLIQDIASECFVAGIKYWQDKLKQEVLL